MPQYVVQLSREVTSFVNLNIEADDEDHADTRAKEIIKDLSDDKPVKEQGGVLVVDWEEDDVSYDHEDTTEA